METWRRGRVVLRGKDRRRRLDEGAGAPGDSGTRISLGESQSVSLANKTPNHLRNSLTVPSLLSPPVLSHGGPSEILHSTPLNRLCGKEKGRRRRRGCRVHPLPAPPLYSASSSSTATQSVPLSSPPSQLSPSSPPLQLSPSPSSPPSLPSPLPLRLPPAVDWSSDGGSELEGCLPDRELGVYVATWNMHQIGTLPESLDQLLLPSSQEMVPELYVVGTQETTPQRREWEVLVQLTLSPSHLLIHTATLGELCLLMFLRRDLLWYCSAVQSMDYATRPGAMIKTKGGVGITFSLFGTSFLFICSHFTAHQGRVAERNTDMQRIADNITTNGLSGYDFVFWLGDLNYRVDMDRSTVDQHLLQTQQTGWLPLLLHDQLTKEMLQGHVFQGFSEQPIHFPPSYKLDPNSDTYDSSEKQRIPSWTDRILFHSRAGAGVRECGYNSCQSLRCSDHRPVCAAFRVRLEPSTDIDGIPDTMPEFDREVYTIAHHRRKELASVARSLREGGVDGPAVQRTSNHTSSSVCTLL